MNNQDNSEENFRIILGKRKLRELVEDTWYNAPSPNIAFGRIMAIFDNQLSALLQKEVEKATRDTVNEALSIKVSHPEGYQMALAMWADKKLSTLTHIKQENT